MSANIIVTQAFIPPKRVLIVSLLGKTDFYRGFPFQLLVNRDNFEILEWKDNSCGKVSKNSVSSISKTSEVAHRWDTTSSVAVTVSTSITIDIPILFENKIEISTEVSFGLTIGTTVTESVPDTVSAEVTVPPNQSCVIDIDIPFTGCLRRTYGNGNIQITPITGKYNGIQVGEVRAVLNRCEPLGGSKPCP